MGKPAVPSEVMQERALELARVIWKAIDEDEDITRAVKRYCRDFDQPIDEAFWMLAGMLLLTTGELEEDEEDD